MNLKIIAILSLALLPVRHAGAQVRQDNFHIFDPATGRETINTNFDGHVYTIILTGDKASGLCVDNKKIAANDLPKYDSLITRIVTLVRRDEAQGEKDRAQGDLDRAQGDRDRAQGDRDRAQGERDRAQGDLDRQQGERDRQQGDLDRQQGERDRQQGELDRQQAEEDRQSMRQLTRLLVEKKLIPDAASLKDLVLTDDELIVNGTKTSPEIHKEIKGQYSKWAHLGLSYGNRNNCCTSVHFHIGSVNPD